MEGDGIERLAGRIRLDSPSCPRSWGIPGTQAWKPDPETCTRVLFPVLTSPKQQLIMTNEAMQGH